ncbi:hypothetical protein NP493_583g02005 [Ridgeia piscesae]|uniref:SOSS complex subunit C n=1 Tax=Ridgeia piscesae TaxID=27915 RepID=A0AAD9KUL6_RIDPI|nr:hypothetical protein NP493_583g02005 [Ridgeia piscesae]
MAFQVPNSGQGRQNLKILEELEEQKKRLKLQTQTNNTAPAVPTPVRTTGANPPVSTTQTSLAEPQHMTPAQRAALQHAQANSVGYFVTQDSSFGNLILPVLPRFDK